MGDSKSNAEQGVLPASGARRAAIGCLAVVGILLTVFVVLPYALIALLFWSADGSWDFEGDKGYRYWLFVSGKRVENLGLVAPTDKPVKYSFSGSDGNFPGWTVVSYESKSTPAEVIDAYAKRCESLKAKVTERPVSDPKEGTIAARLECEFAGYLTAEFFAERASSSQVSEVGLRVWGQE